MAVAKITISLPEDVLAAVDAEAEASGESRSFILREASVSYLAARREATAARERGRRATAALEDMKRIAALPKRDARPSLEILRELREHDGFPSFDSRDPDDAGIDP
jgi:predicted transcriptional regulator